MKHIPTFTDFINESASTVLYKFTFKPEYLNANDKAQDPIFVQLTSAQRTELAMYVAIDKIGGYGDKTYEEVPMKEKVGSTEMPYAEVKPIIKSLQKIKIHK